MSGAKVELTPQALREIDDAFEWYLGPSRWDRAVALIASSPTIWPHFEAGTRRYVLSRNFPYDIVYREIPVGIEVVAVAHHSGVLGTGFGVCGTSPEREQVISLRGRLLLE